MIWPIALHLKGGDARAWRAARVISLLVAFLTLPFLLAGVRAAPAGAEVVFDTRWGEEGETEGQFYLPLGVAVDGSDTVYVADAYNQRIQAFARDGIFEVMWGWGVNLGGPSDTFQLCYSSCIGGTEGSGNGQFGLPGRVAVNQAGQVYVADSNNDRIQRFGPPIVGHQYEGEWGGNGTGAGQFDLPYGVAVDAGGYAYVVDYGNARIQKFDPSGAFEATWGWGVRDGTSEYQVCTGACEAGIAGSGEGQLDDPWDIAVGSDGDVYVADSGNHRIQKFDSDGGLIARWGSYCDLGFEVDDGRCDGQFSHPSGVGAGPDGTVYVADTYNSRIQTFTADGQFSGKWGGFCDVADPENDPDECDGQFNYPYGIAVGAGGDVYVADTGNHRIQKFRALPPVSPAPPDTSDPEQAPPAPDSPASPVSPQGADAGSTALSKACNLEITTPRVGGAKAGATRVTAAQARRLFTHGVKGAIRWGAVGGKDVVCKNVKLAILERRGKGHYVPGTRIRVSKSMLTSRTFATRAAGLLKKKRVGRLRQRARPSSRLTRISFKDFNRRSRLGRRALDNLRRRCYAGRFLVVYSAEIDGRAVLGKIGLTSTATSTRSTAPCTFAASA